MDLPWQRHLLDGPRRRLQQQLVLQLVTLVLMVYGRRCFARPGLCVFIVIINKIIDTPKLFDELVVLFGVISCLVGGGGAA